MHKEFCGWYLHCLGCPSDISTPMTTAKSSQWCSLDLDPMALVQMTSSPTSDGLAFLRMGRLDIIKYNKCLPSHSYIFLGMNF